MATDETQATQQSTFDSDAFRTSLMDDISKMIGGITKELKKEMAKVTAPKPAAETTAAPANEDPVPAATTATPTQKAEENKMNLEVKQLREQLNQITKEAAEARAAKAEADRVTAIKDAMAGIQFRDDKASTFFFKSISGDIVRDEEGGLVAKGADGVYLPVTDYIRQQADQQPGLLAPKGAGGSGAVSGKTGVTKGYTLEDIRPGMSKEQKDAIWAQIRQVQQGSA